MKKGRHRRFEEARALKHNEDLDLDSIFDSLDSEEDKPASPAHDAWAEEFDEEEEETA
ncbi:MAG: hypothetical protein HN567_07200 [Actinobacteria bacterium]|nr:hypothetical protein [Actinomycetota bacterium]MBT3745986.1 hypothetical protein [Actinomycetota bacterium]MBT3968870.1 hypothetical protein [Actinomycetota bacterium]MBT4008948.1 hypothetical protein [Actinomycetota bacterium]MBT4302437.1 hypothetical protein [Actinomycetota bacterium]